MASRLRTPALALDCLSACLSLAMVGTAGRSLHVYNQQHQSNPWLLPLWPNHFDSRELQMLIGTSVIVFISNVILAIGLLVPTLPANIIALVTSFLSTLVMIISIAFSSVVNSRAPHRDTLQTWTCRWNSVSVVNGKPPPGQFSTLCHETRFAYYTTIPVFIIQVLLLTISLYAVFARPSLHEHQQIEKQQDHQLQNVGHIANVSYKPKMADSGKYGNSAAHSGDSKYVTSKAPKLQK